MQMTTENPTLKPILIFDGDCGFCTSAANWAARNSSLQLTVEPWQFANLSALGLTSQQTAKRVYLVVAGKQYAGHECVAQLLKLQTNLAARTAGHLMLLWPLSLASAAGYWLVARFRHRLPGGTPACKLPR